MHRATLISACFAVSGCSGFMNAGQAPDNLTAKEHIQEREASRETLELILKHCNLTLSVGAAANATIVGTGIRFDGAGQCGPQVAVPLSEFNSGK